MKTALAVLLGLLAAVAAAIALDAPLRRRRSELDRRLLDQQVELGRLAVVKVQVDDYQSRRARLKMQIEWLKGQRDEAACVWPLPGLDVRGVGVARIDGIVAEGTTLAVLGSTRDPAAVEELARQWGAASWARKVQSGLTAGTPSPTFGLFAQIEAPKCHPPEPAGADPEERP